MTAVRCSGITSVVCQGLPLGVLMGKEVKSPPRCFDAWATPCASPVPRRSQTFKLGRGPDQPIPGLALRCQIYLSPCTHHAPSLKAACFLTDARLEVHEFRPVAPPKLRPRGVLRLRLGVVVAFIVAPTPESAAPRTREYQIPPHTTS